MATIVFVVGFEHDKVQIDDSFLVIDSSLGRLQDLRHRRSRANQDAVDSLMKVEFHRLIRGVQSRSRAVVLSFPQTVEEAEAVRGILRDAYTVRIIVSGKVEREFKKFLQKNFKHSAIFPKGRSTRISIPSVINNHSG